MTNRVVIGVDISKETLDACKLPRNQQIQVSNNYKGYQKLLRWIEKAPEVLFVFEATGAYHRQFEMALGTSSTPFVKVNPKQARRFAQAVGKLAKTDKVDASMLARMGVALDLTARDPQPKILYLFKDLIAARRGLIKDQTADKSRLDTAQVPLIKRQLERRLKQIQSDIEQIDKEIIAHVTDDPAMPRQVDILSSIPGIGVLTSITVLTDMPELGTLDNKQVASLAGLAPMSQSSGKWQGKERIQGGRAILRRAIYMPALVATRVNPDMREKYQQLLTAGKVKKVALTAIMRKLIILANILLKADRKWVQHRA